MKVKKERMKQSVTDVTVNGNGWANGPVVLMFAGKMAIVN